MAGHHNDPNHNAKMGAHNMPMHNGGDTHSGDATEGGEVVAGGAYSPSLDFSDARNSQYIGLI